MARSKARFLIWLDSESGPRDRISVSAPSSRPSLLDAWQVYITHIRQLPDGRITFQIGYEYW